jgi:hypothetical protein
MKQPMQGSMIPSQVPGDELQPQSRRRYPRVLGPFDGKRGAVLPVAIRIHDLSVGGCLIQCFHEEPVGRRVKIAIELPYEAWVTLEAEILYARPDYGYAVKWVDLPPEMHAKLERVIDRLLTKSPTDE